MNKTLIELMIEANVEWPEGAEFAAQDKLYSRLWFYIDEPERREGRSFWDGSNNDFDFEELTEIASDWGTTIITRAEYEAAQDKAERDRISGYKDEPCESAKVSLRKAFGYSDNAKSSCFSYGLKESFKDAALEHKLKQRQVVVDGIEASKEQLAEFTETLRLVDENIASDLAALGWSDNITVNTGETKTTNCRELQVGDVVKCIKPNVNPKRFAGKIGVVKLVDLGDTDTPINVAFEGGDEIWCHKVKFISRPSK